MSEPTDRFLTINRAGMLADFPNASTLRYMVKQGACPGFYSGNRFYIDTEQLRKQLKNMGDENAVIKTDWIRRTKNNE